MDKTAYILLPDGALIELITIVSVEAKPERVPAGRRLPPSLDIVYSPVRGPGSSSFS